VTDYLSHLAARTLNLMPVIQPRPLTAFEPWPSEGALGARRQTTDAAVATPTFDSTPDQSTSEHAANPSTHGLTGDRLNQLSPIVPAPINQSTHPAASPPARSNFTARSVPPRDPAAPSIEREVSSTILAERNAPSPALAAPDEQRSLAGSLPVAERVIVEREQIDREPEKPQATIVAPLTAPIEPAVAAPVASPSIIQPVVERVIDRREDITPLTQSSNARSSSTQVTTTPDAALEPPAPPVIHVTIGRVEVRATPPPAPSRRTPPVTSTMSLEEYLRSRNGGRR
jgi:hypothetical protein